MMTFCFYPNFFKLINCVGCLEYKSKVQVKMIGKCSEWQKQGHSNSKRKTWHWVSAQPQAHWESKYSSTCNRCAVVAFNVCHQDEFNILKSRTPNTQRSLHRQRRLSLPTLGTWGVVSVHVVATRNYEQRGKFRSHVHHLLFIWLDDFPDDRWQLERMFQNLGFWLLAVIQSGPCGIPLLCSA